MATARGRAYSEGKIGIKHYNFMYLIKGIGEPPVSEAESTMFVLAMKYGYQMPMALLEVNLGTLILQRHSFRNKLCKKK